MVKIGFHFRARVGFRIAVGSLLSPWDELLQECPFADLGRVIA